MPLRLLSFFVVLVVSSSCRIERVNAPTEGNARPTGARRDLWVYTSMYRQVLDSLDPVLAAAMPDVSVHWFQAGSEKVAARLEAELAAGATPCDVLITSDPFLYERFKREHRWLRYVSVNGQRTPRALVDLDGAFAAVRVSSMVLVHRVGAPAPDSFAALTSPTFKNEVVLGDPLTSGTALTWAIAMAREHGEGWFEALRDNGARVAGGNAAVLQKIEGHEASVGVLLLENALSAQARGSHIEVSWPTDGVVLVPGYAAILASSQHTDDARAFIDTLLSTSGQAAIERGDMHAVDPRFNGPRDAGSLDALLLHSLPFDEAFLEAGLERGAAVKAAFSQAFSR